MKDNQPRHPYCDRKSPGIRIFLRKHCGMFASRKSGLHPLAPSSDQPSPRGKNHVWRSRKMKSIAGCIFAQSRPQSATNDIAAAAFGRKLQAQGRPLSAKSGRSTSHLINPAAYHQLHHGWFQFLFYSIFDCVEFGMQQKLLRKKPQIAWSSISKQSMLRLRFQEQQYLQGK